MISEDKIPPIIYFLPMQQGTGNATPENVRPIIAPCNLTGIGEIYGGIFDTLEQTITATYGKRLFQDFATRTISFNPMPIIDVGAWITGKGWEKANGEINVMSDVFYIKGATWEQNAMNGYSNTYPVRLADSTFETKDDLATKYKDHYLVYELRYPITYSLTPEQYSEAISQLC